MNKTRRKQLSESFDLIKRAEEIIEVVKAEEQESHDNLPDSIQCGDRGEEMEGYIEILDEVSGYLEEAGSVIEQMI